MLAEREPQIHRVAPGQLQSSRFPFLRHLVRLPAVAEDSSDDPTNAAGLESWNDFLARGRGVADAVVDARTASVTADSAGRSEEHTSELQSLMRTSYAVFCLNKKKK